MQCNSWRLILCVVPLKLSDHPHRSLRRAQRYAAASQLFGYYLVGVPIGMTLAFVSLRGEQQGVFGLWAGVALSMVASSICISIALVRHDWQRAADAAKGRLFGDAHELPGVEKSADLRIITELASSKDHHVHTSSSVPPEENDANEQGNRSPCVPTTRKVTNHFHRKRSQQRGHSSRLNDNTNTPLRSESDLASHDPE